LPTSSNSEIHSLSVILAEHDLVLRAKQLFLLCLIPYAFVICLLKFINYVHFLRHWFG
jgi:hypothetical protein